VKNASRSQPAASEFPPSVDERQELVQLPLDYARSAGVARVAASTTRLLSRSTTQHSRLLSVFVTLLHRYAQQSDLTVDLSVQTGALVVCRGAIDFALDEKQTLGSLVELAATALVALPCDGPSSRSNVALSLLCDGSEESGHTSHDLHFAIHTDGELLVLRVGYDASLLRAQTVERLVDSFALLLEEAAWNDESALYALPVVTPAQVLELERVCDGATSCEPELTVHERFERLARETPAACAVTYGAAQLSYGELNERADQLAYHLVAAGVRPETPVAVCLLPSLELPIALLAIFKASGVYVPLDPTYPQALLTTIVEEVQPVLVLTHDKVRPDVLPESCARLLLDRDWPTIEQTPLTSARRRASLDAPCYVLYTSGTTGRPKGVVATHRNLAHYLSTARARFAFRRDDVFCSLARYTFSISFFELLSPLVCGASLVLLDRDDVLDPARLSGVLERVTVVHAGPSLLGSLFRHLRAASPLLCTFPRMRHASSGGDLVAPQIVEEMKQVFSEAEIFVIYGCTEIACMGCTMPISRARTATRHMVGRPFADMTVRVLDAHGSLVPFGAVGEIHFAGKGLARRYLQRPELTSQKFVCIDGRRLYKTGDMGRLSADGELEILGRQDFQVQLRGIRVELAGIEQTVRDLGLATQVAVIAAAREQHDVRLVAFVVQPRERDTAAFRRALSAQLPDYMVPQSMVALDALPLTPNGKLDRQMLVALALAVPSTQRERSAPGDPRERAIADAFCAVLGLTEVSIDEDFFDLGGHSLTGVLLLTQLRERLGLTVAPSLLFEHGSVRALARAVSSASPTREQGEQLPVLLSQHTGQPELFMLLGVHLYRELARSLEGHFSVYGVFAGSELELAATAPAPSVAALARQYIALIRRVQPVGPYRLGGMSFGGIVAYEVAQQLEDDGEKVESLLLIDAVLPETALSKLRRLVTMSGRELVREVSQRVHSRWTTSAWSSYELDSDSFRGDERLRSLEDYRQAGYRVAAERYMSQIRPYHGNVSLVVAQKRLDQDRLRDPACGFSALVSHLQVHSLPAHHLELVSSPAVVEVAARVREDFASSLVRDSADITARDLTLV